MSHSLTALDLIVGLAVLFAVAFLAAWIVSPSLRQWVERPKFGFQAALESFDQSQRESSTLKGRKTTR